MLSPFDYWTFRRNCSSLYCRPAFGLGAVIYVRAEVMFWNPSPPFKHGKQRPSIIILEGSNCYQRREVGSAKTLFSPTPRCASLTRGLFCQIHGNACLKPWTTVFLLISKNSLNPCRTLQWDLKLFCCWLFTFCAFAGSYIISITVSAPWFSIRIFFPPLLVR